MEKSESFGKKDVRNKRLQKRENKEKRRKPSKKVKLLITT